MKIKELREEFYEASSTLSDIARQLSFAGIAIIWLFRVGSDTGEITLSNDLLLPLYLLVISLSLDFAQYFYKAILWYSLNWYYFKKHQNDEHDVDVSEKVNWLTTILFLSKAVSVAAGYVMLLFFIKGQLNL